MGTLSPQTPASEIHWIKIILSQIPGSVQIFSIVPVNFHYKVHRSDDG